MYKLALGSVTQPELLIFSSAIHVIQVQMASKHEKSL